MARKRSNVMRAAISSVTDDLTTIKGVGPVIATRLRDIGILTFAQLADLTPEDISARVVGLSSKRIAREKWIKQAQKWLSKPEAGVPPKSETVREIRQHYATFTIELLLGEDNSVRRTRVTYVQTKLEESWAGWAELRLVNFITKSAGLCVPLPEPATSPDFISRHESVPLPEAILPPVRAPEAPPSERLANSKLKNVLSSVLQVSELTSTPLDSNMPHHIVHTDEAFNVRILLDLTKVKTSPSIPLNCTVTIWAKKLGTGERQIIGEQQSTFMPIDKIPCVVESRIPAQGTYRLEAMAALTPASTTPSPRSTIRAWQEGGLLHVY
jgi:Helix-hairpin-helix domain